MTTNEYPQIPIFTFDFRKETLTIQYSDGKIEKKETDFRGRWNAPGFNLETINGEVQWLTFQRWAADLQKGIDYPRIRLFLKWVHLKKGGVIITFYAQDKKFRDKTTFEINEEDIIYKDDKGRWIFKKGKDKSIT